MPTTAFHHLFDRLRELRGSAVPVVGAGLASDCGAPGSKDLATALATAADLAIPDDLELYAIANSLEEERGTAWVQQTVALAVKARDPAPSPAMRAVTLVPGRLIATTNYDNAIELAAREHDLEPVTLTPAHLPTILQGPEAGQLFVLHLHGSAEDASSIILTQRSYDAAGVDQALQLAIRSLAAGRTLVFLGHSLAVQEAHIRRDIRAVAELFGPGEHLLLHRDTDQSIGDPDQFRADTGVRPVACPDPEGAWGFVRLAAQALGAPPLIGSQARIARCTQPVEAAYQPMLAAPAAEVADDAKRAVWLYGSYFGQPVTQASDLPQSRLLLIGAPGTGKTQTMLHLAAESADPAVYLHLGKVTPPWGAEPAVSVFVHWMEHGCAMHDDVSPITSATLADGLYCFFLDGLDEVQPDKRAPVLAVLAEVADQFPQHRVVVASRRVAQLEGALPTFADYELVPSKEWLVAYAAQRGVDAEQIDDITAGAAGLDELLQIPLYAAAAVDVVLRGAELPGTPLGLLLDFASKAMQEETIRLRTDCGEIERWLDRLSLAMVSADTDSRTPDAAS